MKRFSNMMWGMGCLMFLGYVIIGIRTHATFLHSPVVLLVGSLFLIIGGLFGRFVLPKMATL